MPKNSRRNRRGKIVKTNVNTKYNMTTERPTGQQERTPALGPMKNKSVKKTMMMSESPSQAAGTAKFQDARRRRHQKGKQNVRKKPMKIQRPNRTEHDKHLLDNGDHPQRTPGVGRVRVVRDHDKDVVHRKSP